MELHHSFSVPAAVDEAWTHLTDIEGVAGCFPGATVTEADAESFTGTVKVKLGPVALLYSGSGTFVEKDEAAHRLVIDAKGKDKRGNGTAAAVVTATMTSAAGGTTDVDVVTDLTITGKAAQLGRGGVIKDVSDKLLGQFVDCVEQRLTAGVDGPQPAPPAAGVVAGQETSSPEVPSSTPPGAPADDPPGRALDLGAALLPALARASWRPLAVVLAVGVLVRWLWGRRR